jgi:hypothetical protein
VCFQIKESVHYSQTFVKMVLPVLSWKDPIGVTAL